MLNNTNQRYFLKIVCMVKRNCVWPNGRIFFTCFIAKQAEDTQLDKHATRKILLAALDVVLITIASQIRYKSSLPEMLDTCSNSV